MTPISDFAKPYPLHFKGSRLARTVLRLAGWKVYFDGFPAKQGVLVVYPHTSNWDFVVMMLVKWSVGVTVRFWGKDRLFSVPLFGPWLRWVGGVPVDRTGRRGVTAQAIDIQRQRREAGQYFWL